MNYSINIQYGTVKIYKLMDNSYATLYLTPSKDESIRAIYDVAKISGEVDKYGWVYVIMDDDLNFIEFAKC